MNHRLLIASADSDVLEQGSLFSKSHNMDVAVLRGSSDLSCAVAARDYALLLLDESFPIDPNFDWLSLARDEEHRAINVMGATSSHVRSGAHGYIRKPVISEVFQAELRTHLRVVQLSSRLSELVSTDELTGAMTRKTFVERFEDECKRAWRYRTPLCVLMLAIDRFHEIEHHYGERVANDLLVQVRERCTEQLREVDSIARWTSKDFSILLPKTGLGSGFLVAARLRARLSELAIYLANGEKVRITTSVGVAGLSEDDVKDCDKLLSQAELSLEAADEQGRNGVFFHVAGTCVRFAEVGV